MKIFSIGILLVFWSCYRLKRVLVDEILFTNAIKNL
jgi:hypothetical protein